MSMTIDNSVAAFPKEGTPVVDEALLDRVMDAVDERGVALTGEGGFLPELIKAVLERGMKAELTGHLGYEKNDPAGRGSGNSRNGTRGCQIVCVSGLFPERLFDYEHDD